MEVSGYVVQAYDTDSKKSYESHEAVVEHKGEKFQGDFKTRMMITDSVVRWPCMKQKCGDGKCT